VSGRQTCAVGPDRCGPNHPRDKSDAACSPHPESLSVRRCGSFQRTHCPTGPRESTCRVASAWRNPTTPWKSPLGLR
jgi:hypothetical protein